MPPSQQPDQRPRPAESSTSPDESPSPSTAGFALRLPHAEEPLLLLATNNAGKVREMRALLDGLGWRLVTPAEIGLVLDPEETGSSYEENARLKAVAFAAASDLHALSDDSGLEIDALDGAPGLYSARYAGHDTSHTDKMKVVLAQLRNVPAGQRTARFRAVLVAVAPPAAEGALGWSAVREGICEGRIADTPRGEGGFGYDPIFLVEASARTMAELSAEEKQRISHRARAARALAPLLQERAAALGAASKTV